MKRIRLYCASLLAFVGLLAMPNVLTLGTLKEISTPYIGYYQCESLRIGGINFPADSVRLELGSEGVATLYWKIPLGKEQSFSCSYSYDEEKGVLTMEVPEGKEKKIFKIPFKNGQIIVAESLSGKAFFAKFTRK